MSDTPTPIDPPDIRAGDVWEMRRRVNVQSVSLDDPELFWDELGNPWRWRDNWHLVHRPDPDAEAGPEPEWVEGAWYRCQIHITGDGIKTLRRCVNGWSSFEQGPGSYGDDQVTVLGRVLIVDWPGDVVRRAEPGRCTECRSKGGHKLDCSRRGLTYGSDVRRAEP